MKKILKTIAAFGLSVSMLFTPAALSACSFLTPTEPSDQQQGETDPNGNGQQSGSEDPTPVPDPEAVERVRKINYVADQFRLLIHKMNMTGKCAYKTGANGDEILTLLDANKVKVIENGVETYYSSDIKGNYIYEKINNEWKKSDYDTNMFKRTMMILNTLNEDMHWVNYNDETNMIEGFNLLNSPITLGVDGEYAYGHYLGADFSIYDFGKTEVVLPEIDVVKEQNEIYSIIGDKMIFHYDAMASVINYWMQGHNDWKEDLADYKLGGSNKVKSFERVIYINTNEDSLEFGGIVNNVNGNSEFFEFKVTDSDFLYDLYNGYIKTRAMFFLPLNVLPLRYLSVDGYNDRFIDFTADDEDPESRETLEKLTSAVFERLKEQGVQKRYQEIDETTKQDWTGYNILWSFKTVNAEKPAAYGLGSIETWRQYYFIEQDGKVSLYHIEVASTLSIDLNGNGTINSVIEGDKEWIIIDVSKDKEIDGLTYNQTLDFEYVSPWQRS